MESPICLLYFGKVLCLSMLYFMKHHVPDLNKGKQGRTKENQGTSAWFYTCPCARSIAGHSEWDCLNACDASALIVLTSWQNFAIQCLQFTRFRRANTCATYFVLAKWNKARVQCLIFFAPSLSFCNHSAKPFRDILSTSTPPCISRRRR